MILEQCGIYPFRKEINQLLGVKIKPDKNGKLDEKGKPIYYWIIDEAIFKLEDVKKLENEFPDDVDKFIKRFNEKIPKTVDSEELSDYIENNGYVSNQLFTIEADVENCNSWNEWYYCDLIFTKNGISINEDIEDINSEKNKNKVIRKNYLSPKTIKAKIHQKYIPIEFQINKETKDNKTLNNMRIKITGNIKFNQKNFIFQFYPIKEIEVISNSIKKQVFDHNYKVFERNGYIKLENSKRPNPKEFLENLNNKGINLKKIGLISNGKADGFKDFKEFTSNEDYKKYIIFKNVTLTVENVIEAINELKNECQILCIVRGGGSGLEIFDDYRIAMEIAYTNIPITITAVGHTTNKTLCDYVADYDAQVPANVAKFINQMLYTKNHPNERSKKQLEEEIERLNDEIIDLRNQLKQKNSQNLISRIGRIFNT